VALAGLHIGVHALQRPFPVPAPADRLPDYDAWHDACEWVRYSDIPRDARFITPRLSQTFKWYTGRPEVANWKEIPQDAEKIVQWWRRMGKLYGTGLRPAAKPWYESLAQSGTKRLRRLGELYDADYVITAARPPLDLEVEYDNRYYCIYRLREGP